MVRWPGFEFPDQWSPEFTALCTLCKCMASCRPRPRFPNKNCIRNTTLKSLDDHRAYYRLS